MTDRLRAELRALPLTLAKLLGGLIAAFGSAALGVSFNRSVGSPVWGALALLGGLTLFFVAHRVERRRALVSPPPPRPRQRDLLVWALFLLLVAGAVWAVSTL